jgi:two-component system, NarL family, response regulator NreC
VITIVLADDHRLVREGVKLILEREGDLTVIGEAADGLEVAALTERLRPDVLLLDVVMPGLGGLDAAREVRRRAPDTRIVMVSMYAREAFVAEALRNGALGYVLKDAAGAQLVHAIREALAGRRYLSPPLAQEAVDAYLHRPAGGPPDPYEALSAREREVLHLAAEGLGNQAIGARLGMSPRTAETHRAHVMQKLRLGSTAELIAYAARRGLVLPEK